MYFRMKSALFFRFFDDWYLMKYLLTEASGKQYVLCGTLKTYCFHKVCFPRSQSISVNCQINDMHNFQIAKRPMGQGPFEFVINFK